MINFGWQSFESLLRNAAQWGSGYLVTSGILTDSQATLAVGAVMAIAAFGWSLYNKSALLKADPVE